MSTPEKFHLHLDGCQRCRMNPFNLCAEGHRLLCGEAEAEPPMTPEQQFREQAIEILRAEWGFTREIMDMLIVLETSVVVRTAVREYARRLAAEAERDAAGVVLGKICVIGTLAPGEKLAGDTDGHAAVRAILHQVDRAEKAEAELREHTQDWEAVARQLAGAEARNAALEAVLVEIRDCMGGEDMHGWDRPEDVWGLADAALRPAAAKEGEDANR